MKTTDWKSKRRQDKQQNRKWPVILCQVRCSGFGWDRVKSLHSSSQGSMFQICNKTVLITHPCFSYC